MKRTPLKRGKSLKRKGWMKSRRDRPRRNEGRINHGRIKEKEGAPTDAQIRFREWVRAKGCLVTGGPATIHHVTSDGYKRITRSHWLIVPLRADLHQAVWDKKISDPTSVEQLSHAGFKEKYGIDLLAEAKRLRDEYYKGGHHEI